MASAFLALAGTNLLLIVATMTVGWMVRGEQFFALHFAMGLVTTFFTCLTHCIVLTYFMATSKMMALAVQDAGLDVELDRRARGNKLRAYRFLMPGILLALLVAGAGAWVTTSPTAATMHAVIAIASILFHLWAWTAEYQVISLNSRLMDEVFRQHYHARNTAARTQTPGERRS